MQNDKAMLKIRWHKRAVAQLHQVEEYVLSDFGERIRQEFMDEAEQAVLSLAPRKPLSVGCMALHTFF